MSHANLFARALTRLPPREMQIIAMRFGLGGRDSLTQKEVADQPGYFAIVYLALGKAYRSRMKKDILKWV